MRRYVWGYGINIYIYVHIVGTCTHFRFRGGANARPNVSMLGAQASQELTFV